MESKGYYIALVGKNPLPIYTAILYYGKKIKNILLMATDSEKDSVGTVKVAENIKNELLLKIKDLNISIECCRKSDIKQIRRKLGEAVRHIKDECRDKDISIILDYTGGTKIMSAVCYSAMEKIDEDGDMDCRAVYVSYFNHVIKEAGFGLKKEDIREIPIEYLCKAYEVTCDDIINLHGRHDLSLKKEYHVVCDKNKDLKFNLDFDINKEYFTLIENVSSNAENKSQMVKSYFQVRNIAQKLGGSNTQINFKINRMYKNNKDITEREKRSFMDSIREIYDSNENDRLIIIIKER